MRKFGAFVFAAVVATACSSSSDDEETCAFAGTYTYSMTIESGNCPQDDSGGAATVTVTESGGRVAFAFAGVSGACEAATNKTCKVDVSCPLVFADPVDPARASGTLQFAATFTDLGFSGYSTTVVPGTQAIPDGCSQSGPVAGRRR